MKHRCPSCEADWLCGDPRCSFAVRTKCRKCVKKRILNFEEGTGPLEPAHGAECPCTDCSLRRTETVWENADVSAGFIDEATLDAELEAAWHRAKIRKDREAA